MLSCCSFLVALCFTFGRSVKDKRQGIAIFAAMFIMLAAALAVCAANEQKGTPQLAQNGAVAVDSTDGTAGGTYGRKGNKVRYCHLGHMGDMDNGGFQWFRKLHA